MEIEVIRECPFCGGFGELTFGNLSDAWVYCLNCGAEGPYFEVSTDAVYAWNNRYKRTDD